MAKGKVYFVAELAADFGARDVGATQYCESEARAVVQRVRTARKRLELVLAETILVGDPSIQFGTQSKSLAEIVLKGKAAGVDMTARNLNAQDSGAGVAGEEEAEVEIETGLVRKGLLHD